jgi:hypothetical protein
MYHRVEFLTARRRIMAHYLLEMRKPRLTPEEAEARRAYQRRVEGVRSGALPGLLENGKRMVRADIRELIDAAIARKRNGDATRAPPAGR